MPTLKVEVRYSPDIDGYIIERKVSEHTDYAMNLTHDILGKKISFTLVVSEDEIEPASVFWHRLLSTTEGVVGFGSWVIEYRKVLTWGTI